MDDPLVIAGTFSNRLEAEIAKGALDAAGIESAIHTDDMGGLRPDLAVRAGVLVVVRESDAAQAAEVLRGDNAAPPAQEPDSVDE